MKCPAHIAASLQVEDNVLTYAADGGDTAVFEGCSDFRSRGFQELFFLAQPDGFDNVSGDMLGEAAGDSFDFGEFGHGSFSIPIRAPYCHTVPLSFRAEVKSLLSWGGTVKQIPRAKNRRSE